MHQSLSWSLRSDVSRKHFLLREATSNSNSSTATIVSRLSSESSDVRVNYPNGDVYQGGWQHHTRHRWGRYLYLSMIPGKPTLEKALQKHLFIPRYEGNWVRGQKDGTGTFLETEEQCAAGQWSADLLHGFGIQFLSSLTTAEHYEGHFVSGHRHGYGRLSSRRRVLLGHFQRDQPQGACLVSIPKANKILIREYDRGRAIKSFDLDDVVPMIAVASAHVESNTPSMRPRTLSSAGSNLRRASLSAKQRSSDDCDLSLPPRIAAATQTGIATWTTSTVICLVKHLKMDSKMEQVIIKNHIDGEAVLALLRVCCADSARIDEKDERDFTSALIEELDMDESDRPLGWFFINCCNEIARLEYRRKQQIQIAPNVGGLEATRQIWIRDLLSNLPELSALLSSSSDIKFLHLVGEGGFGRVYKAFSTKLQITVAAKEFRKDIGTVWQPASRQFRALKSFASELAVLAALRHPNVALLLGVVIDRTNPILLSEFVEGGSLYDLLQRKQVRLSPKDITSIAMDICAAMRYLHNEGVLHCDLKSSNILISKPTNDGSNCSRYIAKVCDLGLAKSFALVPSVGGVSGALEKALSLQDAAYEVACKHGTAQWMAPELFRGNARTRKSDVYAFGLIVWEMCTGCVPFSDLSHTSIHASVGFGGLRIKMPPDTPRSIHTRIIEACTNPSPSQRPDFADILRMLESNEPSLSEGNGFEYLSSSGSTALSGQRSSPFEST